MAFRCFANEHFDKLCNGLVPIGESFPAIHDPRLLETAHRETQRLLTLLGIRTGALNFDFVFTEAGELFFLELGRYFHETMAVKVDNAGSISLTPETRMKRMDCFLRMYRNVDRYTEGRHRDILRWKIARLTLGLARENLKVMRFPPFFKYIVDSLRHDPGAAWEAAKRRLCLLRGVCP